LYCSKAISPIHLMATALRLAHVLAWASGYPFVTSRAAASPPCALSSGIMQVSQGLGLLNASVERLLGVCNNSLAGVVLSASKRSRVNCQTARILDFQI
jgi:hypothetical protein